VRPAKAARSARRLPASASWVSRDIFSGAIQRRADKLNPSVMRNQIAFTAKMTVLMDRLTPNQLHGKSPIADAVSLGVDAHHEPGIVTA
jgi:hypothetical protein